MALERWKFVRYALKFERAFKSDDWTDVAACFTDDATYTISGSATEFDAVSHGPQEIVGTLKKMLDRVDRRYDKRSARPTSWLHVKGGQLTLSWRGTYVKGKEQVVIAGTSRCRFRGSKICELSDEMPDHVAVARWMAVVEHT